MPRVTIDNRIVIAEVGTTLSRLLPGLEQPCSGKGICGKCKVRAEGALSPLTPQEQRHLTVFDLADGLRLACCATVQGDCCVERLDAPPAAVVTHSAAGEGAPHPAFSRCGAAVDVGTTTLAARLYAPDGSLLAEGGTLNPQTAYGADVVSRVEAARNGRAADLAVAVREGLSRLLAELAAAANLTPAAIDGAVITGNTVMLTLLTQGDVTPFTAAPFACGQLFGGTHSAAALGLEGLTCPVYLTPCASAFFGGDAIAAILASGMTDSPDTALLADVGTNGELALWHGGKLYACSTAAGPAFEGVGISCGMTARRGAVHAVDLVNGTLHPRVIGGGEAVGLCGSGLIDAAACLLMRGDLSPDGGLEAPVPLAPRVILTPADVRALQLSKSAIRAGIDTLLHTAAIDGEAVETLYLAGGLGSTLDPVNGACIGLWPAAWSARLQVLGNAALEGAARLLLDTRLRPRAERLAGEITPVELATDPYFADAFIKNLSFEEELQ